MFEDYTKGKGVRAKAPILQGAFVAEYKGDLITKAVAKDREIVYDAKVTYHFRVSQADA